MRNYLFLMIFILLSQLQADRVLFGATKDSDKLDSNIQKLEKSLMENRELRELQERYSFKYSKKRVGDYSAIVIEDVENIVFKESLVVLLKPIFKDIFTVSSNKKYREEEDKSLLDNIIKSTRLINKWHIIILLTILGFIFLYRRFRKLKEIKSMQSHFKESQDIIQDKLDKII